MKITEWLDQNFFQVETGLLMCFVYDVIFKARIGVALLMIFTLFAAPIHAQQAAMPEMTGAVESAFGWMKGDWSCAGTFPRTGRAIKTNIHIETTLEGARLMLRQDDQPPNQFHALAFWGWSKELNRFTSRVLDSVGGDRLFSSPGWTGGTLTWSREQADTPVADKFVFVRNASTFGYRYDVLRDGQWSTVDVLECKR
jgi:hypothetical protein